MKKYKNINSILLIILLLVAFMVFLNTYSFKEKVENITVESDTVVMNGLKKKIEYCLSSGKSTSNFYNMDKLLGNVLNSYNQCDGLIFLDNDNNLIYSTFDDSTVKSYEQSLSKLSQGDETYNYVFYTNDFISSIEINDIESKHVATLYNISSNAHNISLIVKYIIKCSLIFFAGALILILVLTIIFRKNKNNAHNNKIIVIGLLVFQLITMSLSFITYENSIVSHINYSIVNMTDAITSNFNKIIENHIDTDDLSGFDEYIQYVKNSNSSLEEYNAEKTYDKDNNVSYKFVYKISDKYIYNIFKTNLIDAITIFIISIFFYLEISNVNSSIEEKRDELNGNLSTRRIRAQAFFLFIAYNLSIYFVPIQMLDIIKTSNLAFSSGLLVGLPTSTEALMIALSSIVSGTFIDKYGTKKIYIIGNMTLIIGLLMSYVSHSPYLFILSRAVCGIGYGVCLLNIRTYAACCEGDQISEVIAGINASAYASVNISSITGGYIGEIFGIRYTFIVSVIMCLLGYIYCNYQMSNVKQQLTEKLKIKQIFSGFFKEKGFILSVIMVLLPISVCIAFVDYFYPLYASDRLMFKLTDISKGYLFNGLIIVLLGVSINKFIVKFLSLRGRFISSSLLLGGAIVLFGLTRNTFGIYSAIVIISLAMTYVSGSYIEYFMSFGIVKRIGLAKSMGFYTLFDKIGAYFAPMVYSVILIKNTQMGLIILGIYTLISVNIFCVISKNSGRI